MNRLFLTSALAVFFGGAALSQSIPERRENQQDRIAQGIASGALTPSEAARLERQQRSIRKQVHRDRKDGAGFTARERAKTRQRLNNASRDTHRLKNNARR